ncbi:MAG: hypothetical protein ACRECX_11895 [Methyloceanibacter sp.]|uniref:hypothetical protein n=1 Tax=Methyloceanibacter sp. TaxID=1965321 RepID=UPI003D6C96A6
MELVSDPAGIAPERLLVFEVKGSIQNFIRAASRIQGLEFIGEEELEAEEEDSEPVLYLMVPNSGALTQILSLWARWLRGEELGYGFASWRDLFGLLRDLRPWGPQDRLSTLDADHINEELVRTGAQAAIRLELELVFRQDEAVAGAAEDQLRRDLNLRAGVIVSRSRIADIAYHALLVDLPAAEVQELLARRPASLASVEPVMFIRPQSLASKLEIADLTDVLPVEAAPDLDEPILALLDGVPVAQHPLLANRLIVDDLFGLEPITEVSQRFHGTAMASIIVHGDRNLAGPSLPRRIFVTPGSFRKH